MEFTYKIPLIFLGLVPILAWGMLLLYSAKDKKLEKFATGDMVKKIRPPISWNVRIWKTLLFSLAISFLILALARPKGGIIFQNVQNQGRDLVVLLDLSKSMLAEDVQPNRIERAKKDIMDLVDVLKGDRVALIVFAGRVEMRCPLTLDYNFFKWALDECQPGIVALGGTAIGDAIREAIKILGSEEENAVTKDWFQNNEEETEIKNKAILLITDGEDHETAPLEAAAQARKENITIFTVGFGDDGEGSRIPITSKDGSKEYLKNNQGQIVWSKLNEKLLMDIALSTKNGTYFPAKTRNINMRDVYENYIAQLEVKLRESAKKPRKKEQFQLFLILACLCLIIESFLLEGTMKKRNILVLLFFVVFFVSCSDDKTVTSIHHKGNELYKEAKFLEAKEMYQEAELMSPENGVIHYNIANTFYSLKEWDSARKHYQISTNSEYSYAKKWRFFATAFNEGCLYYREAEIAMSKTGNQEQITNTIKLLQKSLEHFRRALSNNPESKETLHNLKFVKLKLKTFLDMLHKKQQEQKEKQENSIFLLAQIRKMQIFLLRQANMFVDDHLEQKLSELQVPQNEITKIIEKLEKKIQEDFESVKQQVNQGNQGQLNPQAASQIQQMEQMLVFAKQSIKEAQKFSSDAAEKLKNNQNALTEQEQTFNILEPLWQLLATPDVVIQEDILLQAFTLNDMTILDIANEKKWTHNTKHQDMAIAATELFIQKFAIMETAMANMPQPQQGQDENAPAPQVDKEKVKELSQQALAEQKNSAEFIQQKNKEESITWSTKALETLQKIAEELGQKNDQQQNQDNKDDDKNQNEEEQKQQQQKEQQQKEKQDQPQQAEEKDKEKLNKDQMEKMMQKVKERMQKHKKDKEDGSLQYSGGVDNDW